MIAVRPAVLRNMGEWHGTGCVVCMEESTRLARRWLIRRTILYRISYACLPLRDIQYPFSFSVSLPQHGHGHKHT